MQNKIHQNRSKKIFLAPVLMKTILHTFQIIFVFEKYILVAKI